MREIWIVELLMVVGEAGYWNESCETLALSGEEENNVPKEKIGRVQKRFTSFNGIRCDKMLRARFIGTSHFNISTVLCCNCCAFPPSLPPLQLKIINGQVEVFAERIVTCAVFDRTMNKKALFLKPIISSFNLLISFPNESKSNFFSFDSIAFNFRNF